MENKNASARYVFYARAFCKPLVAFLCLIPPSVDYVFDLTSAVTKYFSSLQDMFLGFFVLKGIHTMISTQAKPKLLVISGPSGSGKSTLIQKLFGDFPDKFGFSVSHTTRGPRPGEINGVHYHFTTKDKIQKAIDAGEFIESAVYTNHLCGTSKSAVDKVLSEGKICVLDIDTQGVRQMKSKSDLESVFVFIKPPSLEVLEKRLRDRKTETEENIQRRLKVAEAELDYAKDEGNFNIVIVNDDLERAYTELLNFLLEKYKNFLCPKNN